MPTLLEIFLAFLRLGLTSFGGPIAHLGYFRQEFVVKRRWLDDAAYADLVALCQFLPGPASSQVGFALGVQRAGGLAGGLAAWLGFTAPSALALILAALGWASLPESLGQGLIQGLKLVAVAVVAQALWGMRISLTPDRPRQGVAFAAFVIVMLSDTVLAQVIAIGAGAIAGLIWCRTTASSPIMTRPATVAPITGGAALALFAVLLAGLPVLARLGPEWQLFDDFYRAGALVFGGGHVVLPLLEAAVVRADGVQPHQFLIGYGLAQAVPGPLFTLAAYLGTVMAPGGWSGATLALVAIFLPGLLLVYGTLPFWDRLRSHVLAQAALRGANAAVVGVLGAAFYDPVVTSALRTHLDVVLALGGVMALMVWRVPPWALVLALMAPGMAGFL